MVALPDTMGDYRMVNQVSRVLVLRTLFVQARDLREELLSFDS
jgi:hypothetical protein